MKAMLGGCGGDKGGHLCRYHVKTPWEELFIPVLAQYSPISRDNMDSVETYKPAFTEPPGTNFVGIPIKGLVLPSPYVCYGRPYYELCAKHVKETFHASRVYIIASRSLAANTDRVEKLIEALGRESVVGVQKGLTPHTPWSEILSIAAECRKVGADCVVTLGAGSTTDGAKLVVLVSLLQFIQLLLPL